jgi:hypothetical protein
MMKSLRILLGTGILAAAAVGISAEAGATVSWGPTAPTWSAAQTDNSVSTPGDTVTMQTSVFNGSAFSTVNSNIGPFNNQLALKCSDGSIQASSVNGTNTSNGNLAYYCPFFTSAVWGAGQFTSN